MDEAVQRVLFHDVDTKVAEKVEELWQKGKHMLSQVQQKHHEKTEKLATEVSKCLERQRALEAENEQLKQVVASLASRLALLNAIIGGTGGSGDGGLPEANLVRAHSPARGCTASPGATTAAGGSSIASVTPPQTRGSSTDTLTPLQGSAGGGDGFAPLPEVPAFPFPSQPQRTGGAPLSLAEALGSRSKTPQSQPTPLSLASSLPHGPSLEAVAQCYGGTCASSGSVFSFTIRKADETDLGLNVSHHQHDKVLFVEGVRAEGAVDAWNRQCVGGAFPEKAVIPGDKIISVNNVAYDPEKMLEECKERRLLRLTIARGEVPLPELPEPSAPGTTSPQGAPLGGNKLTALRAEASEFVPTGTSSPAVAQADGPDSAAGRA